MIWNEQYECLPSKEKKQLQYDRLKHIIQYVYDNVPFYHQAYEKTGIKPKDFKQLADLAKYPTLTKIDMRDNYPFKLFAKPLSEIIRLHASSGTTGKPIVADTPERYRSLGGSDGPNSCVRGCTRDSVVQNAYGYGLFTGGLEYTTEPRKWAPL